MMRLILKFYKYWYSCVTKTLMKNVQSQLTFRVFTVTY